MIDGDTLVLAPIYRLRLRLLECWAPETRTRDPVEKARGIESREALANLIGPRDLRVWLPGEGDLTQAVSFGRALGRAWVLDEDGQPEGEDLSALMVSSGHATKRKPLR